MPYRSPRFVVMAATLSLAAVVASAALASPAVAKAPPGKGKPTASASPTSSPTQTPSPTPSVTVTPSPDPTQTATPSPTPSETVTPSPDPTGTATPSPDPTQTATPSPTPSPTPTTTTPPGPVVEVMAAVGDSITVAYDAAGYGSYPQYSWATGSSTTVNSHWLRLQATLGSSVTAANLAVVGAASADLAPQISAAVGAGADYLTIEIGANDACTSTVAGMTPVAVYDQNIRTALATFHAGRPDAEIFVASIPNLYRMWEVSKTNFAARFIWGTAGICQSMLASPGSTSQTDENRRLTVQQRVDDYNAALAAACTPALNCTFDDYAVAEYRFTSSDVSTSDYFHPSVTGQSVLAAITWPSSPFASGG